MQDKKTQKKTRLFITRWSNIILDYSFFFFALLATAPSSYWEAFAWSMWQNMFPFTFVFLFVFAHTKNVNKNNIGLSLDFLPFPVVPTTYVGDSFRLSKNILYQESYEDCWNKQENLESVSLEMKCYQCSKMRIFHFIENEMHSRKRNKEKDDKFSAKLHLFLSILNSARYQPEILQ